jgi:hypothetical protein
MDKNRSKIGPNGSGFLSRRKAAHMITIDSLSADYLFSKAIADHKTPADIHHRYGTGTDCRFCRGAMNNLTKNLT